MTTELQKSMYLPRVEEITLTREQPTSRGRTFLPTVPSSQETSLGKAFGFAEIRVPRSPQIDELLSFIENTLEQQYRTGTLSPEGSPEKFFADTMQKISSGIEKLFHERHIKIDPDHLSLFFGAIHGTDVFMTGRGAVEAYLIRRAPGKAAQVVDLFRGLEPEGDALLPHLLSGAIGQHDLLFFGNKNFLDTLPVPDMVSSAVNVENAGIAAFIRNRLLTARPTGSAIGLIARLSAHRVALEPKNNSSVVSLVSHEEEVARTLAPSGLPKIGALVSRLGSRANEQTKTKQETTPPPTRTRPPGFPKPSAFSKIMPIMRRILGTNKWIGLGILAAAGALVLGLHLRGNALERQKADRAFNQAVTEIRTLNNEAESSLIYDETRAAELFRSAQEKLALLPIDPVRANDRATLERDLKATERRLLHISDITAAPAAKLAAAGKILLPVEGNLISTAGAEVVKILPDNSMHTLGTLSAEPVWGTVNDKAILFYLSDGTFASFDTGTSTATPIEYAGPISPRTGLLWGGRLYVVTTEGKSIWRIGAAGAGYGKGAVWLKDSVAGEIRAFAINTNVYAAITSDAIRSFSQGKTQPFVIHDGPSAEHLVALEATDGFLYGLSDENTLAVWDRKTGAVRAQYVIAKGDSGSAIAFVTDEKNKSVAVITKTGGLLRFGLSHLSK